MDEPIEMNPIDEDEEFRLSERRYRGLFESISSGVVVYEALNNGKDFLIKDFNRSAERIENISRDQVIGRSVVDAFPGVVRFGLFEVFQRVWRTGKPEHHPSGLYTDDRISGWRQNQVYKLPSGELVAVYDDVTRLKEAEAALMESAENFRSLAENANDGIVIGDSEGRHVFANHRAAEITGYSVQELMNIGMRGLAHPDQVALLTDRIHKRLAGEEVPDQYETAVLTKDGRRVPVEITGSKTLWRGEPADIVVIRDISERVLVMEQLKSRSRELGLINRAGHAISATLDLEEVLATVPDAVRELLGVTRCSAWLVDTASGEPVCHRATDPHRTALEGKRLPSGEGLIGKVVRSGLSRLVDDMTDAGCSVFELEIFQKIGIRSILCTPMLVAGEVVGVLLACDENPGRFHDQDRQLIESLSTTVAVAIENARLYRRARQDAETMTTLLREVNHRVNNNLATIIGLLSAEGKIGLERTGEEYRELIRSMVNRVRGLATVHSMLAGSQWSPLNLSELAERILQTSVRMMPSGTTARIHVTPSQVEVPPDQAHNLAIVFNELAINAVKHALADRDRVEIEVLIRQRKDLLQLEFRDDGPGYPDEVLRFEKINVGFDMILDVVKKSLYGEVILENDGGAVARIEFRIVDPPRHSGLARAASEPKP